MTFVGTALARLADYRDDVLFEQSPAEARRVRVLGGLLRGALAAAGLSRRQFAERTGLPVELIVAVENGYGRPETAQHLLKLARAGLGHP